MQNYNENNISEKIVRMLDDDLSPQAEKQLNQSIEGNDDYQNELREHLTIRNALKKDKEAFTPPAVATAAIFATLGIDKVVPIATNVAQTGSSIFAGIGKFVFAGVLGIITTVGVYFAIDKNDSNNEEVINQNLSPKIESNQTKQNAISNEIKTTNSEINQVVNSKSNLYGNSSKIVSSNAGNINRNNNIISQNDSFVTKSDNQAIAQNSVNLNSKDQNVTLAQFDSKPIEVLENPINENPNSDITISRNSISNSIDLQDVPYSNVNFGLKSKPSYYFGLRNGLVSWQFTANTIGGLSSYNLTNRISMYRISSDISEVISGINLSANFNTDIQRNNLDFIGVTLSLSNLLPGIKHLNSNIGEPNIDLGIAYSETLSPGNIILPNIGLSYSFRTPVKILNFDVKYQNINFNTNIIGIGISINP